MDIALKNKYGFIEFEDKYDAEDACKDLDDTKLCGERVRLEMSKVIWLLVFFIRHISNGQNVIYNSEKAFIEVLSFNWVLFLAMGTSLTFIKTI